MQDLKLTFLGGFQVARNGVLLRRFSSDKVRALLVYLAVENQAHSRTALARLLWPGYSEESARHNLRQALYELRNTLGTATPPFLLTSRLTIQFNPTASLSTDVQRFSALLAACATHTHTRLHGCAECLARMKEAAELYQGDFLADFVVDDSDSFEEWRRVTQERLHVQALDLLMDLADAAEAAGDDETASEYARRQLALEPWLEAAHRQIMRVLARRGQRNAATTQYNLCRQILADELGAEPDAATTTLYEQIRAGLFPDRAALPNAESHTPTVGDKLTPDQAQAPSLATYVLPESLSPSTPFVARDRELAQLQDVLAQSLAGSGQVAFISGEAGSGKSALIRAFAQQAQNAHPELIVAGGTCNAHMGAGDPYLPFRALVNLLTGGLEAGGREGLFAEEQALRLWQFMPVVVPLLVEVAADLVDSFVPSEALLARAESFAAPQEGWVRKLKARLARAEVAVLEQNRLFTQLTDLLQRLAIQRPLLLLLDDLHWADPSSLQLLFHLGRTITSSRIMILGAYRPEDVTSGADGKPHPFLTLLNEFKRSFGNIEVGLDQMIESEGRRFVDALLDSQPNHLDETFRQAFYQHTEGHALFTTELLRHLQTQGHLQQDTAGYWVLSNTLEWAALSPKVEGVIEERIGRLTPALRQILQVASVEGEEFTAEVVARVQMMGERDLVRQLGEELERRHRLVSVQGLTWIGAQRLSYYRFRHNLYQKYLYQSLSEVERAYLHADIVAALETLFAEQIEQVVVRLARHCQAAGLTDKAVAYFLQAGERAQRLSAYPEAISYLRQGLTLLYTLPDTPLRAQREVTFQLQLSNTVIATKGYGAPEVGDALQRALTLSRQLNNDTEPFWVLHGLHRYSLARGEWQEARDWAAQLVKSGQERAEPALLAEAHRALGMILFYLGEFAPALQQFEQGLLAYQRQADFHYLPAFGQEPGMVCHALAAMALWMLGDEDQAQQHMNQALALATAQDHPLLLTSAQAVAASFYYLQHEVDAVRESSEAGLHHATYQNFDYWDGTLLMAHGWALTMSGQGAAGVVELRQGLSTWLATGAKLAHHAYIAMLAEAVATSGEVDEGLALITDALAAIPGSGRFWEAEIYRLKGEFLLMQDARTQMDEAERCFQQAIAIAQEQSARALVARATQSLNRLRQQQGKSEEVTGST